MLLFVRTETNESKPVRQESNHTVILPHTVSVLWPILPCRSQALSWMMQMHPRRKYRHASVRWRHWRAADEMASSVRPLTRSSCAAVRKPSSEFCNEMDVQDLEEVEWAGWRAASKGLIISGESFFIKNGPSPASFSFIFVFSNKHYNFTANKWEKGPSSIWRWDSNLL